MNNILQSLWDVRWDFLIIFGITLIEWVIFEFYYAPFGHEDEYGFHTYKQENEDLKNRLHNSQQRIKDLGDSLYEKEQDLITVERDRDLLKEKLEAK